MELNDGDEHDSRRPPKRARRSPPPTSSAPITRPSTSSGTASSSKLNGNSNSASANGYAPGGGLPPLSLSILGVEPLDEFIREVADFVHAMIANARNEGSGGTVEVEAKIGVLKDKITGQRLQLPVLTETILPPGNIPDRRFESNMSAMQHKHFNTLLNNLKTSAHTPLSYEHLHLVDSFYSADGARGERVRVTRDDRDGTVRACVRKVRLGDLDVYSPKRAVDWRVSVNLEIPVPQPIGTATFVRKKDRMSYTHEEFVIDLTQVTSITGGAKELLHELELELARPEYLFATAAKRGDPGVPEHERGAFDELIRAFVNNARIMVRNAGDGWQ